MSRHKKSTMALTISIDGEKSTNRIINESENGLKSRHIEQHKEAVSLSDFESLLGQAIGLVDLMIHAPEQTGEENSIAVGLEVVYDKLCEMREMMNDGRG